MTTDIVEKYQVAGLDERERGFSRLAEIERLENGYRAVLRYETALITTTSHDTTDGALHELIRTLQAGGYRQLRMRLDFRGASYLGTQEPWVEYPDPEGVRMDPLVASEQLARRSGWIGRILKLFSHSD